MRDAIAERNSESASQVKVVSHVGVRTRAPRSLRRIETARETSLSAAAAGFFLGDPNQGRRGNETVDYIFFVFCAKISQENEHDNAAIFIQY